MNKKNWIIPLVILALVVLVIVFRDKFIVKEEDIIEADYCEVDSDCVLAVYPSLCCVQGALMNKKVVELDEDYVLYEAGVDYSKYEKTEVCKDPNTGAAIRGCVSLEVENRYKIICLNNKCIYNVSV